MPDFFQGSSTTTQQRNFTQEAKQALQREVPLFLRLTPLMESVQLGGMNTKTGATAKGTEKAAASVLPSVQNACEAAGLDMESLSHILGMLDPTDPAFHDILNRLKLAISSSVPSLVDPRFAVGLRPTTTGSTETNPSPFQILQTVGSIAGAAVCWVALRLYGSQDMRFYMARFWMSRSPSLFAKFYRRYGKVLSRSALLCNLLRPVMARAWKLGLKEALTWQAQASKR